MDSKIETHKYITSLIPSVWAQTSILSTAQQYRQLDGIHTNQIRIVKRLKRLKRSYYVLMRRWIEPMKQHGQNLISRKQSQW